MNNKGQGMGIFLIAFVAVIVGLVLMQAIATQIASTSQEIQVNNATYTAPAAGQWIDLVGQELLDTPFVTNCSNTTNAGLVTSGNYTIEEGVSATTGLKTIRYRSDANSRFIGRPINITYQYGADGYITDTGTSSIVNIILIFVALGIAVVALVPTLRSGVLQMMGR